MDRRSCHRANAPLPDVDRHFEHAADFFFMPLVALVGSKPPDDVLPHLTVFQGERFLERTIEPNRTVTAWLSEGLMLGAEADYHNTIADRSVSSCNRPLAIAERNRELAAPPLRETHSGQLQNRDRLQLSSREPTTYVFEIDAADAETSMIHADEWMLPGLTVHLARPDTPFTAEKIGDVLRVQFELGEPITLIFSI